MMVMEIIYTLAINPSQGHPLTHQPTLLRRDHIQQAASASISRRNMETREEF